MLILTTTCDEVKLVVRIAVVVKPRCAIGCSDPIERTVFGSLRILFNSALDEDSPAVLAFAEIGDTRESFSLLIVGYLLNGLLTL